VWGDVEAFIKAVYAASAVKSDGSLQGGLSGGGGS
jgi:hypothetical protein